MSSCLEMDIDISPVFRTHKPTQRQSISLFLRRRLLFQQPRRHRNRRFNLIGLHGIAKQSRQLPALFLERFLDILPLDHIVQIAGQTLDHSSLSLLRVKPQRLQRLVEEAKHVVFMRELPRAKHHLAERRVRQAFRQQRLRRGQKSGLLPPKADPAGIPSPGRKSP